MPALAVAGPPLAAEHVDQYREDGFLVVRQLFSTDEVAALAAEAETLFARQELIDTQNIRCRWQNHATTGECRFDCFDPVIDIGPVCRYFAYRPAASRPFCGRSTTTRPTSSRTS